jgi:hypothetical protein
VVLPDRSRDRWLPPPDAIAVVAAFFQDAFVWTRGCVRVVADGPERGRSLFTADEAGSQFVAREASVDVFFEKLEAAMVRHVARCAGRGW